EEITIETPPKKELGDFCFGPFLLSKNLGKNPALIVNELKNKLQINSNFLEITTAGPYLNLKLSYNFYTDIFLNENIKIPNIGNGRTVIVDYIGTNIGKAMHIGHMCPSNQGQVTCNLYRLLGYNVIGDSHLGDWGIIFGKLILAYKLWGDEEKLKQNAVDYLQSLYIKITQETEKNTDLEEKIRQEFKKLSLGDKQSIKLWELFTKYSLENVQIQNDRLGVKSTYDIGESFYEGIGLPKLGDYPDLEYKMSDIIKELIQKGIATQNDDGSVGVIFDEKTKLPSVMVAKRDGTHGYFASDLTAIKYRMLNWNPEKIIYHTDIRQELHFCQAFEVAKTANWLGETKLVHAPNGFISLKDGAMSSRKGNIIKLSDLLDEAKSRAKKIILEKRDDLSENEIDEISEIIGIGSIKYGYLSKSRNIDMVFDWDEFMSFEGNSFPYVAYTYVRGLRILEKSNISLNEIQNYKNTQNFSSFDEIDLFKEISALNEILLLVYENIMAHNLVNYAYTLAKKFSAFYNNESILNEENFDKKILKLKLINKYIEIQKIIFQILAIKLPNKM
ncbi:MAG: arginine--tRNA ligase, partial [Candidatus Gracilibacteria bacterium]|nr:arginine--tRNA ligase [Candidatus Gracilibacteria bacterium]